MAPVVVFDDDMKNKLTATDKIVKSIGGGNFSNGKLGGCVSILALLGMCFTTYYFMGFKAIPHVVVFACMLWKGGSMMSSAFCNAATSDDDNQKPGGGLAEVFKSGLCPFKAYALFLVACFGMYSVLGGNLFHGTTWRNRVAYVSCCLEGFGLVSLLKKIRIRGHVQGLSGMSMAMFALTYTMREVEAFCIATVHWHNLNDIFLEVLQISSMVLSLMVLWAVFITYRTSYERDLDVLKVQYLIPGCLMLSLVLHPEFRRGSTYSMSWAASFYVDVLALLPQVVMMQRGDGIVEAPIAHFVAATAVSRTFDLLFWYDRWHRGHFLKYMLDVNISVWIIAVFHLVSLALVADFMYYYFKWRVSSSRASKYVEVPVSTN